MKPSVFNIILTRVISFFLILKLALTLKDLIFEYMKKIKKIIGLKFKKIRRRSKYLLFFFDEDIVMLVHLGMTGKFFFVNSKRRKY